MAGRVFKCDNRVEVATVIANCGSDTEKAAVALKLYIESKQRRGKSQTEVIAKIEPFERNCLQDPSIHEAFHTARAKTGLPRSTILPPSKRLREVERREEDSRRGRHLPSSPTLSFSTGYTLPEMSPDLTPAGTPSMPPTPRASEVRRSMSASSSSRPRRDSYPYFSNHSASIESLQLPVPALDPSVPSTSFVGPTFIPAGMPRRSSLPPLEIAVPAVGNLRTVWIPSPSSSDGSHVSQSPQSSAPIASPTSYINLGTSPYSARGFGPRAMPARGRTTPISTFPNYPRASPSAPTSSRPLPLPPAPSSELQYNSRTPTLTMATYLGQEQGAGHSRDASGSSSSTSSSGDWPPASSSNTRMEIHQRTLPPAPASPSSSSSSSDFSPSAFTRNIPLPSSSGHDIPSSSIPRQSSIDDHIPEGLPPPAYTEVDPHLLDTPSIIPHRQ